jgi:uncharacterized protein
MTKQKIAPVIPTRGVFHPISAADVVLKDGFWAHRQKLNTDTFLDHADGWIERMGWYDAFVSAAGGTPKFPMQGKVFTDSDCYKLLEGMFWEAALRPDPRREDRIKHLVEVIAAAQEDDGYLNTFFGHKGKENRYTDLAHGHELYCAGHMFQAAVARIRGGVDDAFTRAAIRYADRLCEDFGENGIDGSDGHPEIEVALVELYRATGTRRYLDQAIKFINYRGYKRFEHHAIGWEYYPDDVPVWNAKVLRGHVVRALYLAASMVDVAVELDDPKLLASVEEQWINTWAKRTYITGAMGSRHLGESYGDDYELPPDRAYTETCGSVAAIMVAWRLLLATGKGEYADAIERLLFNMVATHWNEKADRVFYVNPLLRREPGLITADGEAPFRKDTLRSNWFWVSCCPTNIARTFASLSAYFSTVDANSLTIQQYFTGSINTTLTDGREVGIDIKTSYPWSGKIRIEITKIPKGEWILRARIPQWAKRAEVIVNGKKSVAESGYLQLSSEWKIGDIVEIDIEMQPRVVQADYRVNALRDTVAFEYGPLVYCLESVLGSGTEINIDDVTVQPSASIKALHATGPNDVNIVLQTQGRLLKKQHTERWPYQENAQNVVKEQAVNLELIPYYAWSNRGLSTMRIFIPTN